MYYQHGLRRAARIGKNLLAVVAVAAIAATSGVNFASAQDRADTLTFAEARNARGFGDPSQWPESPFGYWLWPVYDSLGQILKDGSIKPLLATEWRNVDDETWVYKLRPGVKFHNGETVSATDVVEFLNFIISPDGKRTSAGQIINGQARVASARVIDPLTVEIKTRGPNPLLPKAAVRFWVPEHKARRDMGPAEFNKNPVGTGPYKVVSWDQNGASYTAIEGGLRTAKIKNIRGLVIPDVAARRAAVLSDQVDIAVGLSIDDIETLTAAGHQVHSAPRPTVMTIKLFQSSRENPFNDKRVRQAANYAIDNQAMADHIMKGTTLAASQCAVPGTFGYNPDVKPYPFDPEKAKRLLVEAGYPNGFDTTIQAVMPSTFAGSDDIFQTVSQQLTQVGIRVNLESMTLPTWLKAWFVKPDAPTLGFAGPFQNNCNIFNLDGLDAFDIQSCRKKPAFYCDREEMALIEQAERELDPKKREALVQELLKLDAENAAVIFLVNMVDVFGINKRV